MYGDAKHRVNCETSYIFYDLVQLWKNESNSTTVIERFEQGEYAKQHPLFITQEVVLQLLMYYDGFEVVNQIGSKTCKHHMCMY